VIIKIHWTVHNAMETRPLNKRGQILYSLFISPQNVNWMAYTFYHEYLLSS